jgi:hypothetical protein
MSSPAEVIRQLLVDVGEGVESSGIWPVFASFLPGQPDSALCVYDSAGVPDGRIMAGGEKIIHPGIQVMVRGAGYPETRAKAESIAMLLDAQQRSEVVMESDESYILHNVSRTGDILSLGMEQEGDRRRYLFSINAVLTMSLN